MQKFRLAVIGTGMAWERLHLPVIKQMSDKFEIVAMSNRTEEKLKHAADMVGLDYANIYTDYNDMLARDDIDAVLVAVPIPLNFEVAEAVCKAGKNLIAEKPLAPTLDEAERFLKMDDRYRVKILIAENYRYDDEINIIKNIINDGKIGTVINFLQFKVSNFNEEMKKDSFASTPWRQHPDYSGGTFLDGGIHDLAAIRHLFGKIEAISCNGIKSNKEFCPYSYISTTFKFTSDVVGQYIYWVEGVETQKPAVGLRIFGTDGMIYLENRNCGYVNVFYNNGGHEAIPYKPEGGYYNEWMNFYKSLLGEEKLSVTIEDAFGDMKLVFDILENVEQNIG